MDLENEMPLSEQNHADVMRELGGIQVRLDSLDSKFYDLAKSIEGNGQPGLRQGQDELKSGQVAIVARLATTEADICEIRSVAAARFGNTTAIVTIIIAVFGLATSIIVAIAALHRQGFQ